MWLRRKRKWPRINFYQESGPGDIKALSQSSLNRLMRKASINGWSAEGRPEWFRQQRSQFREATLIVFGCEERNVYRCIATVVLSDGSGGRFTLDVSISDYNALENLTDRALVIMAHRYLGTFPAIDLDEAQAETWDQSVWKQWGEA
jgi:hypothetical protein